MVTPARFVQRASLYTLIAASALFTNSCGDEGSPGSSTDTLLVVIPQDTDEAMFGRVSGILGVNDEGCFAVDDRVLVAGKGSRILENGDAIDIADVGVVEVGSRVSGSGGYVDGVEEVAHFAESLKLGDQAMKCQPDADDPSLAVLDPASS